MGSDPLLWVAWGGGDGQLGEVSGMDGAEGTSARK